MVSTSLDHRPNEKNTDKKMEHGSHGLNGLHGLKKFF